MKDKNKAHKGIPWYTIPMMLTVLGAISIIMLFVVYYYNERGIIFWSIIISWTIILLVALLEISRLERLQRDLRQQKEKKIAELEAALAALKK